MNSFLFYDLETTGLNKSFDQILQFAAIRTDLRLKETERYSLMVQLRPDVIPSPSASITHRITIEDTQKGLSEIDAVRHIHALLNTPGTVSLGYNTLGFDDEFLRFSFYRNLLPPYNHQFANGCGRMDLLPVAALYYLYKPDVITWPEIDGRPTLKLEHLSNANALASGRAHDAIVDVEATVELARRFIREDAMWNYLLGYFNKQADMKRIQALPVAFDSKAGLHTYGLMVDSKFGPDNLYQCPVLFIGTSEPYSNQSLWLRLDDPSLTGTTEENFVETTMVYRKRFGEPGIILPPADRFVNRLLPERREQVQENLSWLQSNQKLFYTIIKYYKEYRYPDVPGTDCDAALYLNGFLNRDDQALCNKFHHTPPEQVMELIHQFKDAALKELALRVLFRNGRGASVAEAETARVGFMKRVNPENPDDTMIDFRGELRLTPHCALTEIEGLRREKTLDAEQMEILNELETYINGVFSRHA